MKLFWIYLFIFLQLLTFSLSDDLSDECVDLFESNIHPRKCCHYPQREILKTHNENCKMSCKSVKESCCIIDCTYATTGVLRSGKLNENAVLELYENFLAKNGGGKFDRWMEIVEKSIESCKNVVPQTSSDFYVCQVPQFLMDFLDCVTAKNFLSCPKFVDSKACNLTRKIIAEENDCGKKFSEIFVINHRIWEEKKEEDKN